MALISLGTINKTLIVILIGCIFCFGNSLLNKYVETLLYKNPILTNICISLSRFLTIIPFIILIIRSQRKVKSYEIEKQNTRSISLLYYDKRVNVLKGKIKLILVSAIIYLIQSIFFVYAFEVNSNSWIWDILFASIFYYLIFKVKLYKHHYLTIILIILLGLVIDLITNNLQKDIVERPIHLICKFMKDILFSLYNVIAKYVMEKNYVSIYEFSMYIGFINLVLLIIFAIFDYYLFKLKEYDEYFKNFDGIEFLIILGVIFT